MIGTLLSMVQRYPLLVDGAFVIIAWVGVKLIVEYLHTEGYIGFEIPKWLSLGLIAVIFAVSCWLARRQKRVRERDTEDAAAQLLSEEEISQ